MNKHEIFMYWSSLGLNNLVRVKGMVVNIYIFGKRKEIDVNNFKNIQVAHVIYKYKFRPNFLYPIYKVMI